MLKMFEGPIEPGMTVTIPKERYPCQGKSQQMRIYSQYAGKFYHCKLEDDSSLMLTQAMIRYWLGEFALSTNRTPEENYNKLISDTFYHKMFVGRSAAKLGNYLREQGYSVDGDLLIYRSYEHDDSKLCQLRERELTAATISEKAKVSDLSPERKEAIACHYRNNPHHPEHYKSVVGMSVLDVMEMCCDWHARSTQFGTDFINYIETVAFPRFRFPKAMEEMVKTFCEVLNK